MGVVPVQAEVSVADIADFLVDFAQNDLLGVIANTHLATADASAQARLLLADSTHT